MSAIAPRVDVVAPGSLVELLQPAAVSFRALRERYRPLLEIVRDLIGVIPNCDRYLEIWPTAFRSYNLMVPSFLNLPSLVWGLGAPRAPVALAAYAASRAAGCMYCAAHACSFALRRGVSEHQITSLGRSARERAAVAVAQSLARVPVDITGARRDELCAQFSASDVEWIVLAVAMMGFLDKFMDTLGIELEARAVTEVESVIGPTGWTPGKHRVLACSATEIARPRRGDDLAMKLDLLRLVPPALALERRWTRGVPDRWPAVGKYLRVQIGHDFPLLSHLRHARAIRAIATIMRDHCAAAPSRIGLATKYRAGVVFATVVGDHTLVEDVRALARAAGIPGAELDAAACVATQVTNFDDHAEVTRFAQAHGVELLLAKAASYSPARVTPAVVALAGSLRAPAIVETVAWLSVLQMLHRLGSFYGDARPTRPRSRRRRLLDAVRARLP